MQAYIMWEGFVILLTLPLAKVDGIGDIALACRGYQTGFVDDGRLQQ